jgi:hypothetical protein
MEKKRHYKTPDSSWIRKGVAYTFFALCWFGAGLMSYFAVTGQLDFSSIQVPGDNPIIKWVMTIFLIFLLVWTPFILADAFLHPRFEVYENGITRQINTLVILRKKRTLIPYSQMKSFTCSQEGKRCAIHLDPDGYAFYRDRRKEVIVTLRDHLNRNGIAEVPSTCAKCGAKHLLQERQCPHCGESRLWDHHSRSTSIVHSDR